MKIALYKPYKKVFFGDDSQDLSSVSYEVVNVARIFAERGHHVTMLSETDLDENLDFIRPENVSQGRLEDRERFDRVLLFSGTFEKDKIGPGIIPALRLMTPRLDFLLTDLRLTPPHEMWKYFSHVYTQATSPLGIIPTSIPQQYGGVSELYCYKLKFKDLDLQMIGKDIRYAFMGTERGRLGDIVEYVWRPDCQWWGKSDTFNFDNRVDRVEFKQLLERTKHSITIADEDYNRTAFVTPRPYEHYHHGIVNFVDDKFDVDGHLEPLDSWFRVRNYLELRAKMKEIDSGIELWGRRLEEQRSRILPEFLSGDYVYDKLDGDER